MNNLNGFIKIHRQILKWEWYTDIPTKVLFFHLLLRANHQPEKWRGHDILTGELITSYAHLAKETGLTVKQVRTALDKLKRTSEVAHKGQGSFSIISIKNWDKFQLQGKQSGKERANQGQGEGKVGATDKKTKKIEEVKEDKEKKNIDFCCNENFEKSFELYRKNCPDLLPLNFERRSRAILEELNRFLTEIDYDFEYFLGLCRRANDLKKIVDTRIDFRSMIRNHIGIMNGKYEPENKDSDDFDAALARIKARRKEEAQNGC